MTVKEAVLKYNDSLTEDQLGDVDVFVRSGNIILGQNNRFQIQGTKSRTLRMVAIHDLEVSTLSQSLGHT